MTALLTESQGENQDTRLIPLSALQHYAFCPHQCALIHNEQAWAENYLTAQGRALRAYGACGGGEAGHQRRVGFGRSGNKNRPYETCGIQMRQTQTRPDGPNPALRPRLVLGRNDGANRL